MVKMRVGNTKKQPVRVILEPWALEWMLNPDDYLDFVAVTNGVQNEWFMVQDSDYGLIVWVQGANTHVDVYDSKGHLID